MSFQEEVKAEASKMMERVAGQLRAVRTMMPASQLSDNLIAIAESVATGAATARLNAGYSGAHDDGGAGRQMDKLQGYLEGVLTGLRGTISETSPYGHTLKKIQQEQDPEYQKYLELKAKFGDK